MPDVKPATQELAPKVVVESKPIVDDSSINRISPQAEADELKLKPPMMESSKTSLSPAAPVAVTSEPARGLISDKLKQVVTAPVETSKYPGGLDPYREPIN